MVGLTYVRIFHAGVIRPPASVELMGLRPSMALGPCDNSSLLYTSGRAIRPARIDPRVMRATPLRARRRRVSVEHGRTDQSNFARALSPRLKERNDATDELDCFVGGLFCLEPMGCGRRSVIPSERLPLPGQVLCRPPIFFLARLLRSPPSLLRQRLGRLLPRKGLLGRDLVQGGHTPVVLLRQFLRSASDSVSARSIQKLLTYREDETLGVSFQD